MDRLRFAVIGAITGCLFALGSAAGAADMVLPGGFLGSQEIISGGLVAIQPDNGGPLVIRSKDGHFDLRGTLYDAWAGGKALGTLQDVRWSVEHLSIDMIHSQVGDTDPIIFGTGPEVTIFTDPKCEPCKRLLSEAQALSKRYTFKVYVIPVLGKASETDVRTIACAADRRKAEAQFISGQPLNQVPQIADCGPFQLQKSLARFARANKVLGVTEVPVVVASDGRRFEGAPTSLAAFLSGEEKAPRPAQSPTVETIRVHGLMAFQPDNGGPLIIMSKDSRYVLKGVLVDSWAGGKVLATLQDVRDAGQHLNLQKLQGVISDVDPITFGSGPQVIIYTDPRCENCRAVLNQALALSKQYTFKVLLVAAPVSKASEIDLESIACAADRQRAEALFINAQPLTQIQRKPNCGKAELVGVARRLLTAKLLAVTQVPVVIAPDDRRFDGVPPDLATFLAAK
ncbi:MAG: thioredoxin fold domain-containing protein [Desulfovibrio sp.]|uniref:thioredoxin fold domain-containing protein n=1 Tax=Desulfovibrio sp. TaxID=885 RepID=UPI00135E0195|nr:thioredoxin fold domain-containing protein [Desulfovibrio sp.]MTJ94345.1 thioredoxin fold domain-containing protein [Desulfovibrio sp.]